jgi:hypothetical protein
MHPIINISIYLRPLRLVHGLEPIEMWHIFVFSLTKRLFSGEPAVVLRYLIVRVFVGEGQAHSATPPATSQLPSPLQALSRSHAPLTFHRIGFGNCLLDRDRPGESTEREREPWPARRGVVWFGPIRRGWTQTLCGAVGSMIRFFFC